MTSSRPPVLAVTDPTAEMQPALDRAAGFASRVNAPLVLLACVFDPYIARDQSYGGVDLRKLRATALDQQMARLKKLAAPLRERGLAVSLRAVFDHPLHEGIVREVLRLKPGVVVKDTHHHSALGRTLLTNTDWHLIRECPAPLWLVKRETPAEPAAVLAAVDPLHEHDKPAVLDRQVIAEAQELSVLYGERLQVVHVFPYPLPGVGLPTALTAPGALTADIIAQLRQDHASALDRLAATVGFPANQVHLREGDPAVELPAAARELRAGMVVLGAVSRSRLRRAIVGSTAERVLENLPCDVVIVKPPGFESPVSPRAKALGYLARERAAR